MMHCWLWLCPTLINVYSIYWVLFAAALMETNTIKKLDTINTRSRRKMAVRYPRKVNGLYRYLKHASHLGLSSRSATKYFIMSSETIYWNTWVTEKTSKFLRGSLYNDKRCSEKVLQKLSEYKLILTSSAWTASFEVHVHSEGAQRETMLTYWCESAHCKRHIWPCYHPKIFRHVAIPSSLVFPSLVTTRCSPTLCLLHSGSPSSLIPFLQPAVTLGTVFNAPLTKVIG